MSCAMVLCVCVFYGTITVVCMGGGMKGGGGSQGVGERERKKEKER